jgi:hypothetical protein
LELARTYSKGVKVRPPPDTEAFVDLPINTIVRLDITTFVVGYTEALVKSGDESFLVGFVRVKVPAGAGSSAGVQGELMWAGLKDVDLQLVESVGDLEDQDVREAVILPISYLYDEARVRYVE